jgi:hypothetical protein
MPSPLCEVKEGAGAYGPTTNGVNVTPGSTVTVHLIDTSADSWSIECAYTDDTSVAATVTSALSVNSTLRTATFTAPAAGKTYIFRSRVNNGVGVDGRVKTSYTTTFGVYTLTAGGKRVIAANETSEGGAFGWTAPVNDLIRSGPKRGEGSQAMADANQTATDAQNALRTHVLTGALTVDRRWFLAVPATNADGAEHVIDASGISGANIIVDLVGSIGTTVTIAAGKTAMVRTNTGGVKRQTADV